MSGVRHTFPTKVHAWEAWEIQPIPRQVQYMHFRLPEQFTTYEPERILLPLFLNQHIHRSQKYTNGFYNWKNIKLCRKLISRHGSYSSRRYRRHIPTYLFQVCYKCCRMNHFVIVSYFDDTIPIFRTYLVC